MAIEAAIPPESVPLADENPKWANGPLRYLLLSLYWLPVSLFWSMTLSQILPARVEDFADALHKGTYLGVIGVLGATAASVMQLVIGPVSDRCRMRWGRRRPFIVAGTFGGIAGMAAFSLVHSWFGLVASFFAIQVFLNVANGPFCAFIPDHVVRRQQGMASSFMGLMQLLGEAGGPLLAGLALSKAANAAGSDHTRQILKDNAIGHLLLLNAGLFLVTMVVAVFVVPDKPAESQNAQATGLFHLNIQANKPFYWLLLSRSVFNLGFYLALGFLAFYVQDSLGFGKHYNQPLMIIQLIAIGSALAGTIPAGYCADRFSKKKVVYVSCAFATVAALAFALAPNAMFAFLMAASFGIGYGIFRAVDWAFACNLLPAVGAAKYMAIWSLSATIPQVLSPAFGIVADTLNRSMGLGAGWRAAMVAAALCVFAGGLLVSRVSEKPASASQLSTDLD